MAIWHSIRRLRLALIIEPGDDVATLRPMVVSVPGRIPEIIGGAIEAIALGGDSVPWLHGSGKNLGLPTNLLATRSRTGFMPA